MTRKFTRKIIYEAAASLKNAIDNNPLSRAAIQELLPDNEIGRNQLLPAFKKITGYNFRGYQRKKRMEAASMMLHSGMAVKEVAIECSYRYMSNFSRDFKLIFMQGPDEWIKNQAMMKNGKKQAN